jgi:hypothetical protein
MLAINVGETVQRLAEALVVGTGDLHRAVLAAADRDRLGDGVRQGALRPLDGYDAVLDGHVDAGRDRDGELANTRHACRSPLVLRHQT